MDPGNASPLDPELRPTQVDWVRVQKSRIGGLGVIQGVRERLSEMG